MEDTNWSILENLAAYVQILSNERKESVTYRIEGPDDEDKMSIVFVTERDKAVIESQSFDVPIIFKKMKHAIVQLSE